MPPLESTESRPESRIERVEQIVSLHPPGREGLIPVLQEIQDALGFIAPDSMDRLATLSGVSMNEIYGVATFYTRFRFTPPAEHTVRVCLGTACHVCGGRQVLDEFENQLKIKAGQVTEDGRFGLERVACVGCCALAPVVVIDDQVHAGMAPRKVKSLIKKAAKPAAAKVEA